MQISNYISKQIPERQDLLRKIHELIIDADKTVIASVSPMMGKEMIIYNAPGTFKYALSSVKNYMSLHVLPIYGSPTLYSKYKNLLPNANFQKGCINFTEESAIPLAIVKQLILDCSTIDLKKIRDEYLASKKTKK